MSAAPHDCRPADVSRRREPRAARAAGLPVGRVTVHRLGVLRCLHRDRPASSWPSFNTSATVTLGGTLTLDAIAAVLVGGTAITGGRGSALQTLGGALLIAVIADVLLMRGFSTGAQILVKGILVLAVVVLSTSTPPGAGDDPPARGPARASRARRSALALVLVAFACIAAA